MHKSHAIETSYGTIGQALYSSDLKRWEFLRDPEHGCQELRALGIDCLAIGSSSSSSEGSTPHVHEPRQRKFLSIRYPEVTPAIPLLLEVAKSNIDSVSEQGTPEFGDLISLGRAVDVDNRKTKSAYRLLAVPDGDHGKDLKLYLTHVEQYGWRRDKRNWLAIPRIQNSEPGWWQGRSGPIQQVSFAPSIAGQSTLLAIRFPTSIFILKPLYRRKSIVQPIHFARDTLGSCIDANQLLSVSYDAQPQGMFVHVSFNPWYKRQFVVIDSNGNWTIYEVKGKANSSRGYQALQIERNKLSKFRGRDNHSPLESEDKKWAKIFWIKDVNMVVASTRLGLMVFDMKQKLVSSHDLNLRLSANDIILDVQQCNDINDLVIVLTSFVISIVRIDRLSQPLKTSDPDCGEVRAEILHTWKHNRDSRDKSLQICHTIDNECENCPFNQIVEFRTDVVNFADIKVVLYSQSKCLFSFHAFLIPQDYFSIPAAVLDPVELQFSPTISKKAHSNFILNAIIEPLTRENGLQESSVQTDIPTDLSLSIQYYILIILWDDYSVTESVHYFKSKRDGILVDKPLLFKKGPLSKTRVGPLDDAMADSEHNKQLRTGIQSNECPLAPYKQYSSSRRSKRIAVSRTVNFGEILQYRSDVCDSLNDLANIIRDFSDKRPNVGTTYNWFHQIGDKFRIHDIDEVSQVLEVAVAQNYRKVKGSEVSTRIFQMITPHLKTFVDHDGVMRLSTVYEKIVAQWLAKLPNNVSGKVRMAKEKLARQIAAELCLASLVLRTDERNQTEEVEQRTTEIDKIDSSAVQPMSSQVHYDQMRQIPDDMINHSYQQPRSSTRKRATTELATLDNTKFPTPSATPSITSNSSTHSAKPMYCTALNRYGYSPSTRTLAKALSRCLNTWNLDEDPYSVDGEKAVQAIITPSDVDDDNEYGMSASERRHLQRRAQRLLKRQRRQAAKATETMAATDNLISLQLRPAKTLQSSQLTGEITTTPATKTIDAGSTRAVPTIPSRFGLSSQIPSSSQNMEKARSSGMQSAEGNAKKRRRVAGF